MRVFYFLLCVTVTSVLHAQYYKQPDASAIRQNLQKLKVLGTVLYLAAHPDDENTVAITYFANERLMTTGYLSMTRGDGGQNLIGGELREKLGLIRTQELMAARNTDGGVQFFTRAVDFGYSKNPEETFRIWDKQEVLRDVVKVIRSFKPDIILTRFPPDARAGHGQHTASAMLAAEAFDIASDSTAFPDQVKLYGTWQVKRLYLNTAKFFNPNVNAQTPGVFTVEMGGYSPLKGQSYPEIAAQSRTMHKSQGFGSRARRGNYPEYFEFQKGEPVSQDLLDGINTTWTKIPGGLAIAELIDAAIKKFNDQQPWLIVSDLMAIRKKISALPEGIWKERKFSEVNLLVRDCLGLYAELTADHYFQSPGYTTTIAAEVINRSGIPIKLSRIQIENITVDSMMNNSLSKDASLNLNLTGKLLSHLKTSEPYWLATEHPVGMYKVLEPELITTPVNKPAIQGVFSFQVDSETINLAVPVLYKSTDPVRGEVYRPVEITPPVSLSFDQPVLMFPDAAAREIQLTIRSLVREKVSGKIQLDAPAGWQVSPVEIDLNLASRDDLQRLPVIIKPSGTSGSAGLAARFLMAEKTIQSGLEIIDYQHIPTQTLQPPASLRLVRSEVKIAGKHLGYIAGAGDEIPAALKSIGYQVTELNTAQLNESTLAQFDAIVLGVRALNVNRGLKATMPMLLRYAEKGGTVIVQYNTNFELVADQFSPFELGLSRDRVTEEDSEVEIRLPDHPALNVPNKISLADFSDWVQERGLYFPNKWDTHFQAPLAMRDRGESMKEGALLIAPVGSGYFVYTGISFFRQLPEGVPGAYRLFANLVSLGSKSTKKSGRK
jgi:LmbE family N-acetylglucosaminyl deacetylase